MRPFACLSRYTRAGASPNNRFGSFEVFLHPRCRAAPDSSALPGLVGYVAFRSEKERRPTSPATMGPASLSFSLTRTRTHPRPPRPQPPSLPCPPAPSSTRDTAIMSSNVPSTRETEFRWEWDAGEANYQCFSLGDSHDGHRGWMMVPALIYPPSAHGSTRKRQSRGRRRGFVVRARARAPASSLRLFLFSSASIADLINQKTSSALRALSFRLCRSFVDSRSLMVPLLLAALFLSLYLCFFLFFPVLDSSLLSLVLFLFSFLLFLSPRARRRIRFRYHVCRKVRKSAHLLSPNGSRVQL